MTLTLRKRRIRDVRLGRGTRLQAERLTLDAGELAGELEAADPAIVAVRVSVAHPGDSTRVVCVKDVIEPRVKTAGEQPGVGELFVLERMAVVTTGPIVGFQEGIIDMSGPGAAYSPFSELALVVLEIDVAQGSSPHQHEAAVRSAGQNAARFIATKCASLEPDRIDTMDWDPAGVDPALPRIAYVYMVLSQGLLHDTYVMGRNAVEGLPLVIDPRVVMDNGVISGNCVSACDKNTTYHHQRNPIIAELLRGHGARWNFAGVVLTNASTRLGDKERSAARAVELAGELEVDGAIVSKEGFGNPDADLMMLLRGLERKGIRTVGLSDEFAGVDGASQSLADTTPEADAIVSTGNANERIELPRLDRTIGPLPDVTRLAGGYASSLRDDGTLEVELQAIVGATNQLGFGRLSCREL